LIQKGHRRQTGALKLQDWTLADWTMADGGISQNYETCSA